MGTSPSVFNSPRVLATATSPKTSSMKSVSSVPKFHLDPMSHLSPFPELDSAKTITPSGSLPPKPEDKNAFMLPPPKVSFSGEARQTTFDDEAEINLTKLDRMLLQT